MQAAGLIKDTIWPCIQVAELKKEAVEGSCIQVEELKKEAIGLLPTSSRLSKEATGLLPTSYRAWS